MSRPTNQSAAGIAESPTGAGSGIAAAARLIAFYLPQYHPIPENDRWWGAGFTEWTNVTKARPLFRGHYQPHLPADLGFYDLRLPETRQAQADLARQYGIHGFCYYHYWFNGKRLLERPFEEVLASRNPDLPFCLCWANERWTRRRRVLWNGTLQAQRYSPEDDRLHAQWLARAFADPRYIRVNGRPLFLINRPEQLPAPQRTTQVLRETCAAAGLPSPYLLAVDARGRIAEPQSLGFDGTVDYQPKLERVPRLPRTLRPLRLLKLWRNRGWGTLNPLPRIYDETYVRRRLAEQPSPSPRSHPCVFVGWDDSPQRGADAVIVTHSSPAAFRADLSDAIARAAAAPSPDERLVFINAWNQWGVGNHLEPDQRHGRAYLQAVRQARQAAVGGGQP